jgi:hypothetical protein
MFTQKYSEANLVDKVCAAATKVCGVEVGPVPADREPGDPFIAQPATDRELDILSHTIRSTGWRESWNIDSKESLLISHLPSCHCGSCVIEDLIFCMFWSCLCCPPTQENSRTKRKRERSILGTVMTRLGMAISSLARESSESAATTPAGSRRTTTNFKLEIVVMPADYCSFIPTSERAIRQ